MTFRTITASLAALALSACAYNSTGQADSAVASVAPAITSADEALAVYYDRLRQEITLPTAPAGADLSANTELTRIAFGSCNHQSRSQHMWAQIAATNPQLFMLIGDNVYGDTGWAGDAAMESTRAAYAKQSSHPEFADFRRQIPMLTTWDDHDYGLNDAGREFPMRRWAEEIFETYWGSSEAVKSRPGIYDSRMFGAEGKRVQIILLDTRYFRSNLKRMDYTKERPPLGSYLPDDSIDAQLLGDAQWRWLNAELKKPADLRLVVSSIQVLTDAHDYEAWETMPRERERLYTMLGQREDSGLLLLSGDRHAGGIYNFAPQSANEELWEITSSSLNLAFATTEANTTREPDPKRVTPFISEENFGLVEIDWPSQALTVSLRGNQGEVRATRTINWAD